MGDGFTRFKKKYFIDALVKSLLVGFALSMLVVAAFLTVITFGGVDFKIVYAVLIGAVAGLLFGTGLFFLLRMNDKRLAKRLDKDLGLNEKIQTMQAFYHEKGEITELQRMDAQRILDNAPTEMSKLFNGWIVFIAVFVLALAFLVTSIVFTVSRAVDNADPNAGENNEPSDVPKEEFEATDHHKVALEALIKEVQASGLQEDAKQAVIAELTLLLAKLDDLKYANDMREYVIQVIKNVRGIVNTVNTTFKLHMYAGDSNDENMAKLSLALYSLDIATIETALAEIGGGIFSNTDSRDGIESLCDELGAVLKNSGIPETDSLYVALSSLYNTLKTIVDNPSYSNSYVASLISEAFGVTASNNFRALIPQQKTNEEVKTYVVKELMRIFGITEDDMEESKKEDDPPETDEPEDRPEVGDDGGFGTGETLFGSNDIVIDPEADPGADIDSINVQYGTIIGRYDAKITEMLTSGEISEELATILKQYFAILITPQDKK